MIFGIAVFFMALFSPIWISKDSVIVINSQESVSEIAQDLKKSKIFPMPRTFRGYMIITGNDKKIVPGEYYFNGGTSLYRIGKRFKAADFRIKQKTVVIPEGSTVADIGDIIKKMYPTFNNLKFVQDAYQYEGYLFPDTYDLSDGTSTDIVIEKLRQNFTFKTKELHDQSDSLGKDWNDIIIMASIIEEEGITEEDRKIIAGILYKRLKANIGLQVDSTFRIINGKTTKDLSLEDLKINSPYNTYLYTGLPPTPISNPGLESIEAAIYPEETNFLYFLTGDDGKMYYSETFEQHIENKRRYL